jgi:hypothetical protein
MKASTGSFEMAVEQMADEKASRKASGLVASFCGSE